MTYEEHMFLSRFLFRKIVDVKKALKQPLATHELFSYDKLNYERREFYERLAYGLVKGLKIDFKNHPPF